MSHVKDVGGYVISQSNFNIVSNAKHHKQKKTQMTHKKIDHQIYLYTKQYQQKKRQSHSHK